MFTPENEEWGASDLGRAVDVNKVIVYRLLKTMAEEGFLTQDPKSRRYRLGPGLILLVRNNLQKDNISDLSRPFLETLRDQTKETIMLTVRRGLSVVVALPCESQQAVRVAAQVGDQAPIYSSATGRLFLAYGPKSLWDEIKKVGITPLTEKTVKNFTQLRVHVEDVRKRGWALDDEEGVLGLRSIAAPVLRPNGEIICCVALRAPSSRLPISKVNKIAREIVATAKLIENALPAGLKM